VSVLLALLSSLLWGTADFLGGTASRRLPLVAVLGLSQLTALVLLVPLAAATGGFGGAADVVLTGVLAGLAGVLALAAFYRALSIGTMGVVAPVAALSVLVPVVFGLARGEQPSGLQAAGMVVAVAGIVLASGPELSGGRDAVQPLLLAAGSAVGFGAVLVLLAPGSGGDATGSLVLTLLIMRLTSVLILGGLFLAVVRRRRNRERVRAVDLPVLVLIGLGDVGANATYAIAARSSLVSVAAVLASLYPVVTALLAFRLHGERLRPVQVAGVFAAVGGVALMAGG
jgi:drug/metabolite transporter (DMT)-like permease